jgi:hypothetical protein
MSPYSTRAPLLCQSGVCSGSMGAPLAPIRPGSVPALRGLNLVTRDL